MTAIQLFVTAHNSIITVRMVRLLTASSSTGTDNDTRHVRSPGTLTALFAEGASLAHNVNSST